MDSLKDESEQYADEVNQIESIFDAVIYNNNRAKERMDRLEKELHNMIATCSPWSYYIPEYGNPKCKVIFPIVLFEGRTKWKD